MRLGRSQSVGQQCRLLANMGTTLTLAHGKLLLTLFPSLLT